MRYSSEYSDRTDFNSPHPATRSHLTSYGAKSDRMALSYGSLITAGQGSGARLADSIWCRTEQPLDASPGATSQMLCEAGMLLHDRFSYGPKDQDACEDE
jgi:hypothetical protein